MNLRNKISFFLILISLVAVLATGLLILQNAILDKKNYATELNSVLSPQISNSVDQKLKNLLANLKELDNELSHSDGVKRAGTALGNFKNRAEGVNAVFLNTKRNKLISFALNDTAYTPEAIAKLADSFSAVDSTLFFKGKFSYSRDNLYVTALNDNTFAAVSLNETFFRDSFELARGKPSLLVTDKKVVLHKSGLKGSIEILLHQVPPEVWSRSELISLELKDDQNQNHLINFSKNNFLNNSFVVLLAPQASWRDLTAPILKSSFGLIIFLIMFSVLIAYSISKSLAQPIEELSELTSQVGKGEWKKIQIAGADAEILKLTTAFNVMIENLKNRERDLKVAQNKVIQVNSLAAVGRMGAGIAHEVKNPLSSILGYGQLIEMKIAAGKDVPDNPQLIEKIREYVKLILDDTRRASKIISDLLTFARQKTVQTEKADLMLLLKNFEPKLKAACETAGVNFATSLQLGENCFVAADTEQIYQVIFNLVQNSTHSLGASTNAKKTITLRAQVSDDAAEIIIADNGPGISAENMKQIFEPFFSTKKVGEGTGLGLALCYGIVQQHNGTIDVSSEPNIQTSFKIRLPRYPLPFPEAVQKSVIPK